MSILRYFLLSIQLTTLVANTSFAYERYNFFSLLTYNVAGLPDYFSGSNPANNSALISPLLNNYDIVLMQEDFIYHRDIVSASRHRYRSQTDCDFYAASPIEPKGGAQCLIEFGDGLNRLSRFPFSQFRRVTWNDCYGYFDNASDCLTSKGFSVARHELAPGRFVDIYNLHADAGSSDGDNEARRRNIYQLLAAINHYSKGYAVIVAGDTNSHTTDAISAIPHLLRSARLTDVWTQLESSMQESIDKILYRSSQSVNIIPIQYTVEKDRFSKPNGEQLSDHLAISVDFAFRF